jgi:enoyl-CoA hydratase
MTSEAGRNTMAARFFEDLPSVFAELDQDTDVRAIVISAEGKAFTYGLDLKEIGVTIGGQLGGQALAAGRTALLDTVLRWQKAFTSIEECRKPVIVATHGWCIGGGIEMITACDVRVCSKDARFSLREAKMAIVADLGGLQRLPGIVGPGHARELAFSSKDIDAERALRIGLVNDVYETREAAIEGANLLARQIADNPPLVVQGVKRVMNFSAGSSVAAGLAYVAAWNSAFLESQDLTEAMAAFLEKRKPDFKGR